MRKNKGFTLVELIVIIAIMSILTGVMTPAFIQYIGNKREKACRQNREALLNIYEKCVYGGEYGVNDGVLQNVINANASVGVPDEYANQAKGYLACPSNDGGRYHGYVVGEKAYIVCDAHMDDVCMADFVGWTGSGDEDLADKGYKEEKKGTKSGVGKTPTVETKTEKTNTIDGVWPYKTNSDGVEDPRWANSSYNNGKGVAADAKLMIRLPKYAHFVAAQSGVEYVFVQGNSGTRKIEIMYKDADSPEAVAQGKNDNITWLIAATGVKYSYELGNDDKPIAGSVTPPPGQDADKQVALNKGDMITVKYKYFDNDGVQKDGEDTYIAWEDTYTINLKELRDKAISYANNSVTEKYDVGQYPGKLYYVPKIAEEINASDFYN